MNEYKYTDETETLVHIVDEQGNSLKSMHPDDVPAGVTILPLTQAEKDESAALQADKQERLNLAEIDKKSIRDIREWIAKQPDAPQKLKDRELDVIASRARIS